MKNSIKTVLIIISVLAGLLVLFSFKTVIFGESLTSHTFIVPKIGIGTLDDPYAPKYFHPLKVNGKAINSSAKDYGNQPVMIVTVTIDTATADLINTNPDVLEITDAPLSSNQITFLESLKIPVENFKNKVDKVTYLNKMFFIMQTFQGKGIDPLNTKTLDQPVDTAQMAEAGITASEGATMRDVLNILSQ